MSSATRSSSRLNLFVLSIAHQSVKPDLKPQNQADAGPTRQLPNSRRAWRPCGSGLQRASGIPVCAQLHWRYHRLGATSAPPKCWVWVGSICCCKTLVISLYLRQNINFSAFQTVTLSKYSHHSIFGRLYSECEVGPTR